jgi:flagellar basal-body rod modification protein FlgD
VQWVAALKKLGVEFKSTDTTSTTETSLNDILESFNTKMNAIMDKLNLITENMDSANDEKEEETV